jgi:integrase
VVAADRRAVASPAQARAILEEISRSRPELTAFFGYLYLAALRPGEAVALRGDCCHLPASGWGLLTIDSAAPRTAAAWTTTGTSHEHRGLKQRPEGTTRAIPIPPDLVHLLDDHIRKIRHGSRWAAVSRRPRRHPQRERLRPRLARRLRRCPRP